MFDFLGQYFTPLDKNACVFFLILAIIFFVAFVLILLNEVRFILFNFKNVTSKRLMFAALMLFNTFLLYFIYRLFYSICVSSLKQNNEQRTTIEEQKNRRINVLYGLIVQRLSLRTLNPETRVRISVRPYFIFYSYIFIHIFLYLYV